MHHDGTWRELAAAAGTTVCRHCQASDHRPSRVTAHSPGAQECRLKGSQLLLPAHHAVHRHPPCVDLQEAAAVVALGQHGRLPCLDVTTEEKRRG